MFELKIRNHFSAAHKIVGHQGKCQHLHGHNWNVDVMVQADTLDHIGMAVDFTFLKSALKEIIEPLDHAYLNEISLFATSETNPTAENISRHIFNEMRGRVRLISPQAQVKRVDVYETDTCSASYFES
jgi:6-pyruvoyltetrahydropterin/6-carboxytetrahydropterin synthase